MKLIAITMSWTAVFILLFSLGSCSTTVFPKATPAPAEFNHWSTPDWLNPPKYYRPMVRWWWPGANVTEAGIEKELALLDDMGFGGVEIQAFTFGIPATDSSNEQVRTVGNPQSIAMFDYALKQARKHELRADLTMSSGWGLGGKLNCTECGTQQLLMGNQELTGPALLDMPLPRPESAPYDNHPAANALGFAGGFDRNLQLVAVLLGKLTSSDTGKSDAPIALESLADITESAHDGRIQLPLPSGRFQLFAVYQNLTNTRLAGAAYPGDRRSFRTVDHLDPRGLQAFERSYFNKLVKGIQEPPDHYFVDSFEFLSDLPWTSSFHDIFIQSRGYDPSPYLPLWFLQGGDFSFNDGAPLRVVMNETAIRAREDYIDVRAELFQSNFIEAVKKSVKSAGSKLKIQALGGYGDYLDVFAEADIPEAEDFGLEGNTEYLRLASSAAHVSGNRIASNEAFVGRLAANSTGLLEADYHWLAGRAFAAGLNQLVYHGHAYPFTLDNGARWYPFESFNITTRLDESNPIWPSLPEFNATLARLSYAMTRGLPATQVAWLMTSLRPPEFDRVAGSESEQSTEIPGPYSELSPVSRVLRQAVLGYDRISRHALATNSRLCGQQVCIGEAVYNMILVDQAELAEPQWLVKLVTIAEAGIPVVVIGAEPRRARGLANASQRDLTVAQQMDKLRLLPAYRHLSNTKDLGPLLQQLALSRPIQPVDAQNWPFATMVRSTADEDIAFIFNGTEHSQTASMLVNLTSEGRILDPEIPDYSELVSPGSDKKLSLTIPAGRYRIIRLPKANGF